MALVRHMKKVLIVAWLLAGMLTLFGCGTNDTYQIRITIPAGSTEAFVFSDEEISASGKKITISSGEDLEDTQVILAPVSDTITPGYVAMPLTQDTPVSFDADKGHWFKIGISAQNTSDTDRIVSVEVTGVEVRIE